MQCTCNPVGLSGGEEPCVCTSSYALEIPRPPSTYGSTLTPSEGTAERRRRSEHGMENVHTHMHIRHRNPVVIMDDDHGRFAEPLFRTIPT